MAVTCKDIMELESCKRLRIVGGSAGLSNVITWPFIKTTDTISEWIYGGEIIFVLGTREDTLEQSLLDLMKECRNNKISAVVMLSGGDYIRTIPRSVIRFANENAIPLFKMPFMLKLIDITREISRYIMQDRLQGESHRIDEQDNVLDLLLQGCEKDKLLSYCFKKIQPLIEADKITGSEYVKTLGCYLECGNDLLHTSQQMYIHRNTMINRMKKICTLLDVEINHPEVRNEYFNVFKILKHYEMII